MPIRISNHKLVSKINLPGNPDRQVNLQPIREGEWSDIQATEARIITDVREIATESEASSLDIPVVSRPITNHHEQGGNYFN